MKELWEQATTDYNLPLTIGLLFFCAYWIISSIGIFEFDSDVEAGIDLDLDADSEIDVSGGGFFESTLSFVNAIEVPLMLVLTIINAIMWGIGMATNHVLNPENHSWIALGLLSANFIVSVLITSLITKPLAPLFKSLKDDSEKALPLVGQVGKVKSRVLDHHYGQVEIPRDKNAPALLNCKLSETEEPLTRGDEILVVKFDKISQRYIVRSLATHELIQHDKTNIEDEDPLKENNLTTN